MQISKKLFTFIFIPSVLININNSSGNSVIRSSATSEATGENAKTETRIETNVNGSRTTVETNSSGRVEVENNNGQTTVRTSKGITPTIIITGVPTEKIKIEEINPNEAEKEIKAPVNRSGIDKLVKDIFQKLLTLFKFW